MFVVKPVSDSSLRNKFALRLSPTNAKLNITSRASRDYYFFAKTKNGKRFDLREEMITLFGKIAEHWKTGRRCAIRFDAYNYCQKKKNK